MGCVVLCLSYSVALSVHVVHSQLAWGVPTTNAWYAAACFPWLVAVVVLGGLAWPLRRVRVALPIGYAVMMLAGEAIVAVGLMPGVYSGAAPDDAMHERLASLQPVFVDALAVPTLVIVALVLVAVLMARALRVAWNEPEGAIGPPLAARVGASLQDRSGRAWRRDRGARQVVPDPGSLHDARSLAGVSPDRSIPR